MTTIYHKHNEQSKYRLAIHSNQLSPWAVIYDDNGNDLYMFRPSNTNIKTIKNANQFMKKNKLPLFDIKKHYVENGTNKYYATQNIDDTIENTKNS